VRSATRSLRWSESSRISIARSSKWAAGKRSTPSLTTARAIASASIWSDLPGSRSARLEAPILCGGTRTTRSPAAISACSGRRETWRQSSIAHTRSSSSPRAQRTAASCPGSLGLDLPGATYPARSRVHRRQRVRALVRVRSDHDHLHRPFVWFGRRSGSPADSSHSGRMPRSYQVTPKVLGRRRAT
jgi:hypothetical protein